MAASMSGVLFVLGSPTNSGHNRGLAYQPRFVFTWPNAKIAVMGPQQLAGVLSIVARAAAASRGTPYDEEADAQMRTAVENQIESESLALPMAAFPGR